MEQNKFIHLICGIIIKIEKKLIGGYVLFTPSPNLTTTNAVQQNQVHSSVVRKVKKIKYLFLVFYYPLPYRFSAFTS